MKSISEETRKRMSESAKKRCDEEWLKKQHERATNLPLDEVVSMYESGMTQDEIGQKLGVSQKVVWRFMKNNGLEARTAVKRDQYGENSSSWKGGVVKDDAGYVLVKRDGHKRAKKCGGYVREHILVAEEILSRDLVDGEVIHHINGIKDDNRPINLALMTKEEHTKYHSLKRYGKEVEEPTPICGIFEGCMNVPEE